MFSAIVFSLQAEADQNEISDLSTKSDTSYVRYTVKQGDNLYNIARQHMKHSAYIFLAEFIENIKKINNIAPDNIIHAGDLLLIPAKSSHTDKKRKHIFPEVMKGVYVNPNQLDHIKLNNIIAKYDSLNLNTVILDFKNINGTILFPTHNKLAIQTGCRKSAISHPNKLINLFHDHNISVQARIVMFKDTSMASAYPSWRPIVADTTTRDTNRKHYQKSHKWCNPYSEAVQAYNLEVIEEVIKLGVDGIQLDYVRFPTESNLLNADFGIPDSVSRSQVIANFVRKVYHLTRKYKIPLAADIFGIVAFQNKADIRNTGQDLALLEPYLDKLHPMIYPSHFFGKFWNKQKPVKQPYYFIYRTCKRLQETLRDPDKIVPYLEAFTLYDNNPPIIEIILQLQAVQDSGLDAGFLFWNGYSRYQPTWRAINKFDTATQFYKISDLLY